MVSCSLLEYPPDCGFSGAYSGIYPPVCRFSGAYSGIYPPVCRFSGRIQVFIHRFHGPRGSSLAPIPPPTFI